MGKIRLIRFWVRVIKDTSMFFTLMYMWFAAILFLYYQVNTTPANFCFIGGVIYLVSYATFNLITLKQRENPNG